MNRWANVLDRSLMRLIYALTTNGVNRNAPFAIRSTRVVWSFERVDYAGTGCSATPREYSAERSEPIVRRRANQLSGLRALM